MTVTLAYLHPAEPPVVHQAFMASVVGTLPLFLEGSPIKRLQPIQALPNHIAEARNACCDAFLDEDPASEWLYFADTDTWWEPKDWLAFYDDAVACDADVVGGFYVRLGPDGAVPVGKPVNAKARFKEAKKVAMEWLGGGSLLIRRRVLEKIEAPFSRGEWEGEDAAFCAKARLMGFTVVMDTRFWVRHNKTYGFSPAQYAGE